MKIIILFALISIPSHASLKILKRTEHIDYFETKKLEDVVILAKNFIPRCGQSKNVLVVFDMDDTVIAAPDLHGSIPWEKNAWKKRIDIRETRHLLRHYRTQMLTQKNTDTLIKGLQRDGFLVVGMTARSQYEVKPTLRELERYGIDFKRRGLKLQYFSYRGGVFFGHHRKGPDLIQILKLLVSPSEVKCIVFADDSSGHSGPNGDFSVFETGKNKLKRLVRSVHYTGLDERYEKIKNLGDNETDFYNLSRDIADNIKRRPDDKKVLNAKSRWVSLDFKEDSTP